MSRIVLDAVGGDHAPTEAIAGVALGEQLPPPRSLLGLVLITAGATLCVQ